MEWDPGPPEARGLYCECGVMEPVPLLLPKTLAAEMIHRAQNSVNFRLKIHPSNYFKSGHSLLNYIRINQLNINDFILEVTWIYTLLAVQEVIKYHIKQINL